jgi:hypothetical protein
LAISLLKEHSGYHTPLRTACMGVDLGNVKDTTYPLIRGIGRNSLPLPTGWLRQPQYHCIKEHSEKSPRQPF